jgi:hypothetical protein
LDQVERDLQLWLVLLMETILFFLVCLQLAEAKVVLHKDNRMGSMEVQEAVLDQTEVNLDSMELVALLTETEQGLMVDRLILLAVQDEAAAVVVALVPLEEIQMVLMLAQVVLVSF